MKKILFIILLISNVFYGYGQTIFQFNISKPYCVFNFLKSANLEQGTSVTLQQYIKDRTKNNTSFEALCKTFSNIRLDYNFRREEFPENRRQYRSTYDLIVIALVSSRDFQEFRNKTIGILPNSEQEKLLHVLEEAEKIYDVILWNDYQDKLKEQLQKIAIYKNQSSEIFSTIHTFYGSNWSKEIPFIVSLYPIPGAKGNTTATPHTNSLCVGVLTDEKDYVGRIGVVLHEMCHVLYDEQSKELQHQIELYFNQSSSPYASFAYNFFDEGLATAIGNGWAYQKINGSLDTQSWYDNEYIDGFAKELFPLVEEYIGKNNSIDKVFVDKAISIFSKKFPNSITDYGILLNKVSIYNDGESEAERSLLFNTIGSFFQVSNSTFSSPITDPISLTYLKEDNKTQLIVIDKNHKTNQKALLKIFPNLTKSAFQPNTIIAFQDAKNRAILIINADSMVEVQNLLKTMKASKYFKRNSLLQHQ